MDNAILMSAALVTMVVLALVRCRPRLPFTRPHAPPDNPMGVAAHDDAGPGPRSLQAVPQSVLDTMPVGVMTLMALKNHSGAIQDLVVRSANRSALVLFGSDHLVGMHLPKELAMNEGKSLFNNYVNVVNDGTPFHTEFHLTANGFDRWIVVQAVRLDGDVLITLTDTTGQRRMQEIKAGYDRTTLIAQMNRTMAHEVRNPLTNIQLATEQLRDEMGGQHKGVWTSLEIIERNVKRIAELLKGMPGSTQWREPELLPCSLADIVTNTVRDLVHRTTAEQIHMEVDVPSDLPMVMVDRHAFGSVMTEIILDAMETTKKGTEVLGFTAYRADDEVVLEVSIKRKSTSTEDRVQLPEPSGSGHSTGVDDIPTISQDLFHDRKVIMEISGQAGKVGIIILRFPGTTIIPAGAVKS